MIEHCRGMQSRSPLATSLPRATISATDLVGCGMRPPPGRPVRQRQSVAVDLLAYLLAMPSRRSSSLPGTDADDGDSFTLEALERVDWTSLLPEPCRLLIVERMESTTREAWRVVNKQACQDVYAATKRVLWRGHSAKYGVHPFHGHDMDATRLSGLLSKLPSLQHFRCCWVEHVRGIQGVASKLRSLEITGHLKDLSPLQHCVRLEQLTLYSMLRSPKNLADTLPAVTSALSPCLRRLSMHLEWGSAPEGVVIRSLAPLTRLQHLKLCLPSLKSRDWIGFASPLSCMTDLQLLDLSNNSMGSAMSALVPAIGQLQLATLQLALNELGADDMAVLAPAIQHCTALTKLDLRHNSLSDQGATALGRALTAIAPSLTSLSLSDNNIGCHGAAALAPALGAMTALRTLRFGYNALDSEGVQALAPALQRMPLRLCYLEHDSLDDEGARLLASILGKMRTLRRLKVRERGLGSEGKALFQAAAVQLPRLQLQFAHW